MIKVGITGAMGLLGFHTSARFFIEKNIKMNRAGREVFEDEDKLNQFVKNNEVIIHLAGMNRGDDDIIYNTNVKLMDKLLSSCEKEKVTPQIIFSSSTHISRDSSYGKSKLKCMEMLKDWSNKCGGKATAFILPNIFGEFGKPFYNTVVSTFCYQLVNNQKAEINSIAEIEFIHASDCANLFIQEIIQNSNSEKYTEKRVSGEVISVSELYEKINLFKNKYENNIIPDQKNHTEKKLFNTYLNYLYPKNFPSLLKLHTDNRGYLFEVLKSLNHQNQIFISSTNPGITRGNHFHFTKVERFCVIKGRANIKIRKLFSDKIDEFIVDGNVPQFIDIPTYHTHNITNIDNSELVTLFWANEIFDSQNPDTYSEIV